MKRCSAMTTHPDFEEFLALLAKHHVEYMLVGGYAVAFHGYPRFTRDLDVFYRCTEENITKLRNSLIEFGFTRNQVQEQPFEKPGEIIHFGVEPIRIDLLNEVDGITFEEALPHAVQGSYGRTPATFIGRRHLLQNKRATPRLKDKADVEELEG